MLQRIVLRAIEEEGVLPEFEEIWKGGSFDVRNGGITFELRISECEQTEWRYFVGSIRCEGYMLSKRIEIFGVGILFRGRERAEMECRI